MRVQDYHQAAQTLGHGSGRRQTSTVTKTFLRPSGKRRKVPSADAGGRVTIDSILCTLSAVYSKTVVEVGILHRTCKGDRSRTTGRYLGRVISFVSGRHSIVSHRPARSSVAVDTPIVGVSMATTYGSTTRSSHTCTR